MTDVAVLQFGPFRLLGRHGPLLRDGVEIKLQPKAMTLLWTLARQSGEVLSRNSLMDAVWPGVVVGDEALTFQIQTLRKALGDNPKSPQYLVTVHRVGFRLALPVLTANAVAEVAPESVFVGRKRELARLDQAYARALTGRRELVFVSGEAGIGKSQLVQTRLAAARRLPQPPQIGSGNCLQHFGQTEPYAPVLEALSRLAREDGGDQLLGLLQQVAPGWLLQMPSLIDAADLDVLQRRTAGTRQDRMVREIAEALELLTRIRPVVIVLEDLHWSDHATLDLLSALARRSEPARLLLIGTLRPSDADLGEHPVRMLQRQLLSAGRLSEVELPKLAAAEVSDYLERSLSGRQATPEITDRIFRRSEGHPLFMTQLAALIGGEAGRDGAVTQDGDDALPPALKDLIELQLGQLAPAAQLVLEVASLLGREFSAAAVAAGVGISADEVEYYCERMVKHGQFLDERGLSVWPDGTVSGRFSFRHVLYEHALRARLTHSRRARMYRQMALRLESAYSGRTREIAFELAHYFEGGGLIDKAVIQSIVAARMALERVAPAEVKTLTQRALSWLQQIPGGEPRDHAELSLRIIAVNSLYGEEGYGSREGQDHLARIDELRRTQTNPALLEAAFDALWVSRHFAARFHEAISYGEEARRLGITLGSELLEFCGLAWASVSRHMTGDHRRANEESLEVIRRNSTSARIEHTVISMDPMSAALTGNAVTNWFLGFPDTALARAHEAVERTRLMGNPFTECLVECWALCNVLLFRRQWLQLNETAERTLQLSQRHSHQAGMMWARQFKAVARCKLGGGGDALRELRELTRAQIRSGQFMGVPADLCFEAECEIEQGDLDQARKTLDLAIGIVNAQGLKPWEPELIRTLGDWEMASGTDRGESAETHYVAALELADARGTRVLQLRAATSLARAWAKRGKPTEALALIEPLYAQFSEGLDCEDLINAQRLIEDLRIS